MSQSSKAWPIEKNYYRNVSIKLTYYTYAQKIDLRVLFEKFSYGTNEQFNSKMDNYGPLSQAKPSEVSKKKIKTSNVHGLAILKL